MIPWKIFGHVPLPRLWVFPFLLTHFVHSTLIQYSLCFGKNIMENYEPVISYVFISIKREQSGTESTKNDKKYVVTNGNDSTLLCSRFRGKTFQFKSHKTFSFFKWRLKIHFQSVSRSSFHVDVKEAFFGAEGGKKMNERMLRTIMKSFFSYAFKCDE